MDGTILPLFSSPLYAAEMVNQNYQEIVEKVAPLDFHKLANHKGSISENQQVLELEEFENLATEIKRHIKKYVRDQLNLEGQWYISNSWFVAHEKGDHGPKHTHPNSLVSGVAYLNVDETSGDIYFHHPNQGLFHTVQPSSVNDETNIFTASQWPLKPPPGGIVLFPSYLEHSVSENESDIMRLTLAFNVFVRGEFGIKTSLLTLS